MILYKKVLGKKSSNKWKFMIHNSRFFFSSDLFSSGLFFLGSYFRRLDKIRTFFLKFYFQVFSPETFFPGTFLHRFTIFYSNAVGVTSLFWCEKHCPRKPRLELKKSLTLLLYSRSWGLAEFKVDLNSSCHN